MKKRLAKMMYTTMTLVLIFSMVATNIVIVTADTDEAEYDALMEKYEEYKNEGKYVSSTDRPEFIGLLDKIKKLEKPGDPPAKEDYQVEDDEGNWDWKDENSEEEFNQAKTEYDNLVTNFNDNVTDYTSALNGYIEEIDATKKEVEQAEQIAEMQPIVDELTKRYDRLELFLNEEADNYIGEELTIFQEKLEEVANKLDEFEAAVKSGNMDGFSTESLQQLADEFEQAYERLRGNKVVIPTDLEELYKRLKSVEKGNYTKDTWNDLQAALSEANIVLVNAGKGPVSQRDVDEAMNLLKDMEKALSLRGDVTNLKNRYNEYKNYDEELYTVDSWNEFSNVLDDVQRSIGVFEDSDNVSQKEMDEVLKELNDAARKLVKRGDVSALQKEYNQILESKVIDDVEQYTADSWKKFEDEIFEDIAYFLENDVNYANETQAQINKRLQDLRRAKSRILKKRGNLSLLEDRYYELAKNRIEKFTAASWEDFEVVFDGIYEFLYEDNKSSERSNADDAVVREKLAQLNDAAKKLVPRGDTISLETAVEKYSNYNELRYTESSWKVFDEALEKALDFVIDSETNENITQADVDKQLDALNEAHDKLAEKGDPRELEIAYKQYEKENAERYTTDSWKPFEKALTEAEEFLYSDAVDLDDVTQEQVDEKYKNLQETFNGLDKRGDIKSLQAVYDFYVNVSDDEEDYTPSSWEKYSDEFTEALKATEAYLAYAADEKVAANISEKEVDDEKQKLMDAYEKLDLRGDTTGLINKYEQYAAALSQALENGTHTTSTMNALSAELERIEQFLADEALLAESTQDDVNKELEKLNKVYQQLAERGDPTELKSKREDYTEDLAKKRAENKYLTESLDALEAELERVADLLADEALLADSTQEDLDKELAALQAAFDDVEERGKIKQLQKAYDKAAKELEANADNYRISAVNALQDALDTAYTNYLEGNDKHADASQKVLDDATANIETLLEVLKSEDNKRGDATELQSEHARLAALNFDEYTKKTREALAKALAEVEEFLTDGSKDDATDADLAKKLENLLALEDKLVKKGDITSIQKMFDKYSNYQAQDYNTGSWNIFSNTMDEVEKFLQNPDERENADREKVKELEEAIQAAVEQLEQEPVDFTEVTEAFNNFKASFSNEDIKKYTRSEEEAKEIIEKLKEIEEFFTTKRENATNSQAEKYVEELNSIYTKLVNNKKVYDLEKEYNKVTDGLSKEEKEEYEDILKEIEEYLKGNRGEITDEKTKEYLELLKEIAKGKKKEDKEDKEDKEYEDILKEFEEYLKGNRGEITEEKTKEYLDRLKELGASEKNDEREALLKEIEEYLKGNRGEITDEKTKEYLDRLKELGSGEKNEGGEATSGETGSTDVDDPLTLSEQIEKVASDPVGTVKDARDKYVLPHTASDNYKYIVTGVLMIVEGLFLYGYFRFFSFLRTRFDLF